LLVAGCGLLVNSQYKLVVSRGQPLQVTCYQLTANARYKYRV
jgi:hypothetical protein